MGFPYIKLAEGPLVRNRKLTEMWFVVKILAVGFMVLAGSRSPTSDGLPKVK